MAYGNRHNQAYDDIIMGYMWKEMRMRPHRSTRVRPTIISVSKIWRVIKEKGYPNVHRTTVIRHLNKLVERHELVEIPKEKDRGRRYNATSFGLVLQPMRFGTKVWWLYVYPSSS